MATRWKSSGLSLSKHANYKDGAGSRDQPNKGGPVAWVKENRHVDKLGHKNKRHWRGLVDARGSLNKRTLLNGSEV